MRCLHLGFLAITTCVGIWCARTPRLQGIVDVVEGPDRTVASEAPAPLGPSTGSWLAASPRAPRAPMPVDPVSAAPRALPAAPPASPADRRAELLCLLAEQRAVEVAVGEGLRHLETGRRDEALAAAQRALDTSPDDRMATALRTLALRAIGRLPAGAHDDLEAAVIRGWVEDVHQTSDLDDLLGLSRGGSFEHRVAALAPAIADSIEGEDLLARVHRLRVSFSVRAAPLLEVVRELRVRTALTIEVDPDLFATSPSPSVPYLDMMTAPVSEALDAIVAFGPWRWEVRDGVIVVAPADPPSDRAWRSLRYFDLRGMVPPLVLQDGESSLPEPALAMTEAAVGSDPATLLLAEIRRDVAPEAWGPARGATLEIKGRILIGRAPRPVLSAVAAWVDRVRIERRIEPR